LKQSALCAWWNGGLSVIRPDECGSAKVAGVRVSSWWCRHRRQTGAAGARGCEARGIDESTASGCAGDAALAYGTESINPVAKIVGPGNAYVAAANALFSVRSVST